MSYMTIYFEFERNFGHRLLAQQFFYQERSLRNKSFATLVCCLAPDNNVKIIVETQGEGEIACASIFSLETRC